MQNSSHLGNGIIGRWRLASGPHSRAGCRISEMPYEFTEHEHEPETQASSSRGGHPPRKITGVGILDPSMPSRRQNPLLPISTPVFVRILAAIMLVAIVVGIVVVAFLPLLPRH